MASLPKELNAAQEKLLHNILDEGINELKAGQPEYLPPLTLSRPEPHATESPLIHVRHQLKRPDKQLDPVRQPQGSSALMKLIEEIKEENASGGVVSRSRELLPAKASTSTFEYTNMQSELSFLQGKIKLLEEKLGSSFNTAVLSRATGGDTNAVERAQVLDQDREREARRDREGERENGVGRGRENTQMRETREPLSDKKSVLNTSQQACDCDSPLQVHMKKGWQRQSSSRFRSDSNSKGRGRSISLSGSKEAFAESLAKSGRNQDKCVGLKRQCEEAKAALVKERQKTHELSAKLEKYERQFSLKRSVYEELRQLRDEYDRLKASFEKSENLRRRQKEIIGELQAELQKYAPSQKALDSPDTDPTTNPKAKGKTKTKSKSKSKTKGKTKVRNLPD